MEPEAEEVVVGFIFIERDEARADTRYPARYPQRVRVLCRFRRTVL